MPVPFFASPVVLGWFCPLFAVGRFGLLRSARRCCALEPASKISGTHRAIGIRDAAACAPGTHQVSLNFPRLA